MTMINGLWPWPDHQLIFFHKAKFDYKKLKRNFFSLLIKHSKILSFENILKINQNYFPSLPFSFFYQPNKGFKNLPRRSDKSKWFNLVRGIAYMTQTMFDRTFKGLGCKKEYIFFIMDTFFVSIQQWLGRIVPD